MALNFPNSPIDGQVYIDSTSGNRYVYDAARTRWNSNTYVSAIVGGFYSGNYGEIGHTYDRTNDVFYPPSPFPSWTLNNTTWTWEAPVAHPNDGKIYNWNEETQNWVEVNVT